MRELVVRNRLSSLRWVRVGTGDLGEGERKDSLERLAGLLWLGRQTFVADWTSAHLGAAAVDIFCVVLSHTNTLEQLAAVVVVVLLLAFPRALPFQQACGDERDLPQCLIHRKCFCNTVKSTA